ncbi:hypothetical protein DSECCO2_401610 [anaerobic digester metagenome]
MAFQNELLEHIHGLAVIGHLKLALLFPGVAFLVAADAGTGSCADLGYAVLDDLPAHGMALPGGQDDSGKGNGQAQDGDDFPELVIADQVRELGQIHPLGRLDSRHGDGVEAHAMGFFQIAVVEHQSQHFELIVIEAEQNSRAHIVQARFHRSVEGGQVIVVVALGSAQMHGFVGGLVIGFLEQDIGSDAGILEAAVVLHRGGRNVDVHPANRAVITVGVVDCLDGLHQIVHVAVDRILTGLQRQPLVAHPLQQPDLFLNLRPGQLAPRHLVGHLVAAVPAVVDAVAAQIERGKDDNAVAVDVMLDLAGNPEHFSHDLRIFRLQEQGDIPVGQRLLFAGFGQNLANIFQRRILG